MPKPAIRLDPELAAEAKSLVAMAFRNGPIEDVHAGKQCPVCAGAPEYSHITQNEMKNIMKRAVDTVYNLLWLKKNDSEKYAETIELGGRYTRSWDEPRWTKDRKNKGAGHESRRALPIFANLER